MPKRLKLSPKRSSRILLVTGMVALLTAAAGLCIWRLTVPGSTLNVFAAASEGTDDPLISPATVAPIPDTLLDEWADQILNRSLEYIEAGVLVEDGLAWWQGSGASGYLSVSEGQVLLGSQPVTTVPTIDIYTVDPTTPNRLVRIGTLSQPVGEPLVAGVQPVEAGDTSDRWIVGQYTLSNALHSLQKQAARRDIRLIAAYYQDSPASLTGQLAIVGVEISSDTGHVTATVTPTVPPATAPFTPAPNTLPTATRVPDISMGRLLAQKVAQIVEAAPFYDPSRVFRVASGHPRLGLLNWNEAGTQVGSLPVAISNATELAIYTISTEDDGADTTPFLNVLYDANANITRLPAEQVYFPDHRMDEMMYWMVRSAAEQGGQLKVVYDDFGATQRLTIIGFTPFQ